MTPESWTDQLARLRQMAADEGETWDLSPLDRAALGAVLAENERLRVALREAIESAATDAFDRYRGTNEPTEFIQVLRAALAARPPAAAGEEK